VLWTSRFSVYWLLQARW